jgi:predicted oxidoreductase
MLLGKNLFQVERDPEDERRLFCQVLVWDDVPAGEKFHNKELSVNFYDHFEKVVKRSGSHDAKGVVLSNIIKLPDKMFNYHLYNYILEYYGIQ